MGGHHHHSFTVALHQICVVRLFPRKLILGVIAPIEPIGATNCILDYHLRIWLYKAIRHIPTYSEGQR